MAMKRNFLMEAVGEFTKEYNICSDDNFKVFFPDGTEHTARFTPMGLFLVDEEIRGDLLPKILSGEFDIETVRGKYILEQGTPQRGFEIIEGHEGEPKIPVRATKGSAGYDFFAPKDLLIPPRKIAVAWTGIKAFMQPDEVLKLYNRSSNAQKKGLVLSNGVGIVDSDYYNNPGNEGDIGFSFWNITDEIVYIVKGEKLGQGVFERFSLADNDVCGGERVGGYGSTGK